MHRGLRIPEIFLAILERLAEDTKCRGLYDIRNIDGGCHYPARKPECLALALTCKRFLEPALDALWDSLTSILPLLAVLLSVKCGDLKELDEMKIGFPREHEPFEIDRVAYYAHRIRALRVGSEHMTPSICRILNTNIPSSSRPMFPKLLCLQWDFDEVKTFPYITLFSSPSLRTLTILLATWKSSLDESIFHGLSTLASYSPCLKRIKLDDSWCYRDDSGRETALILSALSSLAKVDISTSVSPRALLCLAGMPRLSSLAITFYNHGEEVHWTSDPPTRPSFPMLQEVEFNLGEVRDYAIFFASFHGHRDIQIINLKSIFYPTALEFDAFATSIQGACSSTTLKVFSLSADSGDLDPMSDSSPSILGNASLSPFLTFRHMESFDVGVYESHWDDGLLEALANAWPNLRHLSLRTCNPNSPSNFTVGGLYPLAKNCRWLKYLGLSLSDVIGGTLRTRDWDKSGAVHDVRIDIYDPAPDLSPDAWSYLREIFSLPARWL